MNRRIRAGRKACPFELGRLAVGGGAGEARHATGLAGLAELTAQPARLASQSLLRQASSKSRRVALHLVRWCLLWAHQLKLWLGYLEVPNGRNGTPSASRKK